ncbi:MAG: hypothetical protein Kow0077_31750 [Anaerolineae bacterium]
MNQRIADLRQRLRNLRPSRPPTVREALGWLVRLPFRLIRFVVMLPIRLIRFLIHLPRNIWRAWTAGARGIVRLEQELARLRDRLREARRLQRIYLPRDYVLHLAYAHLHPARLWHAVCAFRFRLQPAIWDTREGLNAVPRAVKWARQLHRHRARFADLEALRSILYTDSTIIHDDPLHSPVGIVSRRESVRRKWCAFLHGLVRYSGAQRIAEIGAGYGMASLYLARGLEENYPVRTCMLISLETRRDRARYAENNLSRLGYNDFAEVRIGNIADELDSALEQLKPVNLVLIAGPQPEDVLLRTVSQIKRHSRPGTLIVITHIHGWPAMRRAWHAARHMPQIAASVDLWHWGVLVTGKGPALHICARL